MQLLLLGLTGAEPAFTAWSQWLTRAGVPFDAVAPKDLTTPSEFIDASGEPDIRESSSPTWD